MQDLQVFEHDVFGKVRTAAIDGKPYFSGFDVAKALGYEDASRAILQHCKNAKKISQLGELSCSPPVHLNMIPEQDVYRLIMRSHLPSAEKFQDWVCDEVLPSINKHGMYATPTTIEDMLANPDAMIKALEALRDEKKARVEAESKVIDMTPKALFADSVSASETSILIGDFSKLLRQNGCEMGQNRLFQWLRDNNFLMSRGESYNMPTQRSMEMGLFEVKERTINNPDGSIRITRTTKITGKGQVYFLPKLIIC